MSDNPPFKRILIESTSRFARDEYTTISMLADLTHNSVHIYYVSQRIDTASESARQMIMLNSIVDTQYIQNLAHSTRRGIEGRVKTGYSGGGKKYGYRSCPDADKNSNIRGYRLEKIEEEADTIWFIFHCYAIEFYSVTKIAKLLNEDFGKNNKPFPPSKRKEDDKPLFWTPNHVRSILNNEIYIGRYSWGKGTTKRNIKTGQKKHLPTPDKRIIQERPELRIIPDELWEKAQSRLSHIKRKSNNNYLKAKAQNSEHLLTSLGKCGLCGGTFGIVSGGKYAKYGCTTSRKSRGTRCENSGLIKKDVLEESVIFELMSYLGTVEHIKSTHSGIEQALLRLNDEIHSANAEMLNISKAINAGLISEITKTMLLNAEHRKKELEAKLIVPSGSLIHEPLQIQNLIKPSDLEEYYSHLNKRLSDPITTKQALYSCIEKIVFQHNLSANSMDIEIFENTSNLMDYILNKIKNRDSSTRYLSRTGFLPCTVRVIKFEIKL